MSQERQREPFEPGQTRLLNFRDQVPAFLDGADDPRAYLERCLETIEAREPNVRAFASMNVEGARGAADASAARYKAGRPLSAVDGMPFGIKDLYETKDMPMECNSPYYEGWRSIRDGAHVWAMRQGGAVILGKTTTTEFGVATPPPTRNPFDTGRTAGGSSSGSAAAVGARFLPAASGSQARGSIVRPAGYCGNFALKPTFGALNRGGGHSMTPSNAVLGIHAGSLRDMWETAFHIADTVGGDPGQPGLQGEPMLPPPTRPDAIIRLDTLGWAVTEPAAREEFDRFVAALGKEVRIITRRDDPRIEAFEQALSKLPEFFFPMLGWDMRWPALHYREMDETKMSETLKGYVKIGETMRSEDYRKALKQRAALREAFAGIGEIAPMCIAPAQPGPAPEGMGIGDPVYGDVTSALGSPAIALPLLAVEQMPFAVQAMGQPHDDYVLCGWARWIADWALR